MRVDTTAQIVHNCRCFTGSRWYPLRPSSYELYHGFLIHDWGGICCVMPIEVPTQEVATMLGVASRRAHQLGNGEETICIPDNIEIYRARALVDRFWENLVP